MKLDMIYVTVLMIAAASCGGDDAGEPPPPPSNSTSGPVSGSTPANNNAKKDGLKGYQHVEDLVDSKDEKDSLRHQFSERDFVADRDGNNRDPFRSFVVLQVNPNEPAAPVTDPLAEICARRKLVAKEYSIRELKLAGIVSRGTKRYALMQDTRDEGHTIVRGDCVGREKAEVTDIGDGYLTYKISSEAPNGNGGTSRIAEEKSVQLYPGELTTSNGVRQPEVKATPTLPPVLPSTQPQLPSGDAVEVVPVQP